MADDRFQLALQAVSQVVKVGSMIGIGDDGDGEHAGVREDLKVDGGVAPFTNPDWNCSVDLVPAKCCGLRRTANGG